MNIFVLDEDPVLAARMLCDVHCNKMVLESAQMLANCFPLEQLESLDCPRTKTGGVRKYAHYNHPSSKWVRESRSNMQWLLDHAFEIENERLRRGFNPHFIMGFLQWVKINFKKTKIPEKYTLSKFAVAIADHCECRKIENDFDSLPTVQKYRLYYIWDKQKIAKWKNGNCPQWFIKP